MSDHMGSEVSLCSTVKYSGQIVLLLICIVIFIVVYDDLLFTITSCVDPATIYEEKVVELFVCMCNYICSYLS